MRRLVVAAVHNPVATNLLMLLLIVGGTWSALRLQREMLPQVSLDMIQVRVQFEGATPEEVEESVVIKIEEAISGIAGIGRIFSRAYEGAGLVWAELEPGADNRKVMDEIKDAVERIDTFPEEAKEPRIVELVQSKRVINIVVFGEQTERVLKEVASQIRDDLLATTVISQVGLYGSHDYEISIEVSEEALQRYGLTLEQIRDTIRRSSLNLPAGDIKTPTQDIVIRTAGQRYTRPEFETIPLVVRPNGTVVTLGEVAQVIDGVEDAERIGRFDGQPAVLVSVNKTKDEDALAIAETVRNYVAEQTTQLPAGLSLSVWADTSRVIIGRLQLLTHNGLMGLILVWFCLWLFLNLRLACWVAVGLPVAFAGAFWMLELYGGTLNMITMFACIMVLGILVDDAIVISENIYSHWRRGTSPVQAAIDGTCEVALPVIAAVTTSMAAFLPLFLVEGTLGKLAAALPIAVMAALVASLLEALVIMPPHLAHALKVPNPLPLRGLQRLAWRVRRGIDAAMTWCIVRAYFPLLRRALDLRWVVAATALAILMIALGLVLGGHINFFLFPKIDTDFVQVHVTMPPGTPLAQTLQVAKRLETAAWKLNQQIQAQEPAGLVVQRVMTVIGTQSGSDPGSHVGQVNMELLPVERRGVPSTTILAKWRELVGEIPEVLALTFVLPDSNPGGAPIEVHLIGDHFADLRQAADSLQEELASYPGVFDIQNDYRSGKMEIQLALQPEAHVLGLTLNDLARQVRQGFFGAEALRLQRGRDEVRVMIRYPAAERRSLGDIENMRIRTSNGQEIPFGEVATVTMRRGYAMIRRNNHQRVVTVTADVDMNVANAGKILADLNAGFLPQLLAHYDGMRVSFEGQQRETQRSVGSLYRGFILALLLIYAILATVFRSYVQPLIVMFAIPFGLIGAVLGHMMMEYPLTMMSLFGLMALSGIVVNDSLVLLDFVNRAVHSGTPIVQAVLLGGQARFRAIILTSLTTIAGLLPILAEQSVQAQFLIPMAISVSFGLMGVTFLTLFLVPVLYLLLNDLGRIFRWLFTGDWPLPDETDTVHDITSVTADRYETLRL